MISPEDRVERYVCLLCVIEGRGDVLPDPGMGTVAAYLIIAPFSAELAH